MLKKLQFSTRNVNELEEWAASQFGPVRIQSITPGYELGVVGIASHVKGVTIVWAKTRGDLKVQTSLGHDCMFFRYCTEGAIRVERGGRDYENLAGTALALDDCRSLDLIDGTRHTTVAIDRALLRERLSVLLDRPAKEEPRFFSDVLEITGAVASLSGFLHDWQNTPIFEAGRPLLERSDSIANLLVDLTLLLYPSNVSELLRKPQTLIAPRHVKRAIDYINAYPSRHISPLELAELSHVSVRALQYSFHSFTGQTISAYQRALRLEKSCQDLIDGSHIPLNAIALKWGFASATHFSQAFKERYQVTPSSMRKASKK